MSSISIFPPLHMAQALLSPGMTSILARTEYDELDCEERMDRCHKGNALDDSKD